MRSILLQTLEVNSDDFEQSNHSNVLEINLSQGCMKDSMKSTNLNGKFKNNYKGKK